MQWETEEKLLDAVKAILFFGICALMGFVIGLLIYSSRFDRFCLEQGFPRSYVDNSGHFYCEKLEDQTELVVPVEQLGYH